MRNQVFRRGEAGREVSKRRRWSWLVPGRTPDPDVIDLTAYRRRREERRVAAPRVGDRPKGGAA